MCIIRDFDQKDKNQITSLWVRICVDEYGFTEWKKDLEVIDDFDNLIVAEVDGKVVGTVAYQRFDDETAEIKRLYVDSSCRGMGIAKKLFDEIIDRIGKQGYKKLYLETWEKLLSARRFYEKNGFKVQEIILDGKVYHYERDL